MKRIRAEIFGTVQGVFFRDTTKEQADLLGLSGIVKNTENGTVALIAEGEESNLNKFIEWLKHGPEMAKVEKVNLVWENATGEFTAFQVQ